MQVVATPSELEAFHGCTLVPTMGALHAGHVALIQRAAESGKPVVVSIFVNPTQFGPKEDFATYPRQLARDETLADHAGAVVVFAPSVEVMYPQGVEIAVPRLPAVATQPGLEDRFRPDHFKGVCQVVARLFDLVQPSAAVFGEKDYQQFLVIGAMVQQETSRWGDLKIMAMPTLREQNGLALSSRNVFLKKDERERALGLSRGLRAAAHSASPDEAESLLITALLAQDIKVDYAVVRDAATLMPIKNFSRPARALIAARLGNVRLIDNAAVPSAEPTD